MNWQDRARCLEEDPELFFPEGYTDRYASQVAAARQVCATCEVRSVCLGYAIDTAQNAGVWGGLTPDERKRFARRGHLPRSLPLGPASTASG